MDTGEVLVELGAVLIGLSLLARLAGLPVASELERVGPIAAAYVLILAFVGPLLSRLSTPRSVPAQPSRTDGS